MPHITKGSVFKEKSSGEKFRFAGFTGRDKETAVVEIVGETKKDGSPKTKEIKFAKLKNTGVYKLVKRADPSEKAAKTAKPKKAKAEKPAKAEKKTKKVKKVKAEKPAKVKKIKKVKKAEVEKPAKIKKAKVPVGSHEEEE